MTCQFNFENKDIFEHECKVEIFRVLCRASSWARFIFYSTCVVPKLKATFVRCTIKFLVRQLPVIIYQPNFCMTFVLPLTSRSHLYLPYVLRHFFLTALLTIDSWFDNLLLREGSFNNAVGHIFWRSIAELRILYSNPLPHCVQEINIYCFWWLLSGDCMNKCQTIICTWVWIVCHRYPDPCILWHNVL